MTDYRAKKAALQARLKQLDADEKRIAAKRKQTEAALAALDKQAGEGAKPKRSRRA